MKKDSIFPCIISLILALIGIIAIYGYAKLDYESRKPISSTPISETVSIAPATMPSEPSTVTAEPLCTPTPIITPTSITIHFVPIVDMRVFKITAYCNCVLCCGKTDGIGYGGAEIQEGVTVAADLSVLSLGTVVDIKGIGLRTVQDKGSSVIGDHIDLLMSDHQAALDFGVQYKMVTIFEKEK